MTEDKFWSLIDLINHRKRLPKNAIQPLVDELANHCVSEIREFDDILAKKLYALDTLTHARNIGRGAYGRSGKGFSADYFLYVRLMAVSKGRTFYEAALNDPAKMPKGREFEALLAAGREAFDKKETGEEYDRMTRLSFESFSNEEGWAKAKR